MAREFNVYLVISIRGATPDRKVMRVLVVLLRYFGKKASPVRRIDSLSSHHRSDMEERGRDQAKGSRLPKPIALPDVFVKVMTKERQGDRNFDLWI